MAEKKSLAALKMQLGKLKKKEQTPEVMEQIDALTLQIENFVPDVQKKEPEVKSNVPAFTHEEWRIDVFHDPIMEDGKQVVKADGSLAYKTRTVRDKLLKRVIIEPEHAEILNNQMLNTKKEYVPINK